MNVSSDLLQQLAPLYRARPDLFRSLPKDGYCTGLHFYNTADFLHALHEGAAYFLARHGRPPSLLDPRSFNEKVFFLKYFGNMPVPSLGDKLAAREYVRARLGSGLLPEVVWIGRDLGEIPRSLSAGRYYLKANHGSGFGKAVDLPEDLERRRDELQALTRRWLGRNFGFSWGEWWYCNFDRRLFLEKHVKTGDGQAPVDYKFYCFNGRARLVHTDTDRFRGHKRNFFTPDWRELPVAQTYPRDKPLPRPARLAEMIACAERLAADLCLARIDLYQDADDRLLFGEITLSPDNAIGAFDPASFDLELGARLRLG